MSATDRILVVNAGSSSLKLAVRERGRSRPRAAVLLEALGSPQARAVIELGEARREIELPGADDQSGLAAVLDALTDALGDPLPVRACGHRVVHGGERFSGATRIDDGVLEGIRACAGLAPLHNPPAIRAIEAIRALMPELPQVAVFDTAFHQSMPPHAYRYAIPREWYEEHRVRRYGFHGISYQYLVAECAELLDKPAGDLQLLAAHLGNGCSAAAVRDGRCVDTSMGLTPLEGMVMGTRSGDIDPNVIGFLGARSSLDAAEVLDQLQRSSGLLGLSGRSNDMREILATDDPDCRLAFEVFCYRAARSLLGLAAGLERIDAIVFSGGIGEHAAAVRERVAGHLGILSPSVDAERNASHGTRSDRRISSDDSPVTLLVIPTDEERLIARETRRILDAPTGPDPTPDR